MDAEASRLRSLRRLELLDTPQDPNFVRLVDVASEVLEVPVALVALWDDDRQWFLARHGLAARQAPRRLAFCSVAQQCNGLTVIPDTHADPSYAKHPMVIGEPHVRFYAGHPIQSPDGYRLGSLCVVDQVPRSFSDQQLQLLATLAGLVESEIQFRRQMSLCPLTQFYQRSAFLRLAEAEMQRERLLRQPMALVVLELDGCPVAHSPQELETEERVLQAFAEILRTEVKARDLVGRLGDRQFGVFLVGCDDHQAMAVAERTQQRLAASLDNLFPAPSDAESLQVFGGVSTHVSRDHSVMDVFYRADQAAWEARGRRGKRIVKLMGF